MNIWTIRAGKYGEQEQACLNEKLVTISWNDLPNLMSFANRDQLAVAYQKLYEEPNKLKVGITAGQLWRFANEIEVGDLVALPSKAQAVIHIGKVEGAYQFQQKSKDVLHWRPVTWLRTIPRAEFDQDLLYSFGSLLTVSQVNRPDAAQRVLRMVQGKSAEVAVKAAVEETQEDFDISQHAVDQISKLIARKFKGHAFARLVDEILRAQGYVTHLSPPGADGGIDILAGSGSLGFERPQICVQIKSTTAQADVKTLRELQGVMRRVKADVALLVSWNGFQANVQKEARDEFFSIRLWSANDVVENIFRYYDKFSDELKAEMPLKRIWVLVEEE